MLLWTWQSKKVSLAKDKKLENIKYSSYCNEESDCPKEKHREVYEKVYQKLDSTQGVWCFTNFDEAVGIASIREFEERQDRILWKIDVPEKDIKWYCPVVWNKLRTGKLKMTGFMHRIYYNEPHLFDNKYIVNFKKDFDEYWSKKTEDELLGLMFLEKEPIFDVCSQNAYTCSIAAIVIHPVGKENIEKNPLETRKWWETSNEYRKHSSPKHPLPSEVEAGIKKLRCKNCPGR